MDEYIEREAAIKSLLNDATEQVGYSREDAADCIRYMDAADVAPVRHARWVYPIGMAWNYVCSECGKSIGVIKHKYCPNCGAKMDGGNDD